MYEPALAPRDLHARLDSLGDGADAPGLAHYVTLVKMLFILFISCIS